MPNIPPTNPALTALTACRTNLRAARVDALTAATSLAAGRADRAAELAAKVTEALAYTERLVFIVTGDLRAEQP